MCGIAGFWQTKRQAEIPAEILLRMGHALKHRGPDDSGVFYDDSTGVGLVHRRLSIIDLSPAGHQPMASHSGRFLIIFNGEVYNYEEVRKELGPGHTWRGHSDTEVMLEAFERWGVEAAVRRFVGMFAFALWDRKERKLYLVRDRLGIKPLYYGWVEGQFVFASELKAIRQYPGFQAQIDRDVLALYMRHNYVPAPHSIYQGISKLNAGCILMLGGPQEQPVVSQYWSATEIAKQGLRSPVQGSETEIVEQLERTLAEAVKLRMISDVPLGAFLSGGIDSSTVVALMQSQSARPVKTFTIGFHEDAYNEADHAKSVASHLGTDHTELYVTPQEALNVVPLLPAMYDEPFADVSQVPTYLVSKLARQSVTVSLSGDGGDELFGGYARYFLMKRVWNSMRPFPKPLRHAMSRMIAAVPPETIDKIYKLASPLVPRNKRSFPAGDKAHKLAGVLGADSQERIYMHALTHWDNPSDVVNGACEPETVRRFMHEAQWLPSMEDIMMLTDTVHYLPDDILTKVDRTSMAVSLEARVPLLDHVLMEYVATIPSDLKLRGETGKYLLKRVMADSLPSEILGRRKMGFGVPLGTWLRRDLRGMAWDTLLGPAARQRGIFRSTEVERLLRVHESGRRDYSARLWALLCLELWMERWSGNGTAATRQAA
jgi:asparagine synthase (glutamine-hydrolysing)